MMMPESQSLITELDATLSKIPDSRQLVILQRVTDLFLVGAEDYTDEQIAIFDDVICRLIDNIGHTALIELSDRLSSASKGPANTLNRLSSSDDIAVSGPTLERAPGLTEQDLVMIAGKKGQKQLAAIAGRPQISEKVTNVLVDRGDATVSRKVSANMGARISETGFVKLINKAKKDPELANVIATRKDLPEELVPFLKLTLT
ncbi:MAG: DUF2336 domain-containing protein [Pseudolabrys sp.]|nr:DUF2336 domain-containing protein [Pseudolabrys sp.]